MVDRKNELKNNMTYPISPNLNSGEAYSIPAKGTFSVSDIDMSSPDIVSLISSNKVSCVTKEKLGDILPLNEMRAGGPEILDGIPAGANETPEVAYDGSELLTLSPDVVESGKEGISTLDSDMSGSSTWKKRSKKPYRASDAMKVEE